MAKYLALFILTLILGCSTNKSIPNKGNTYLSTVKSAIENGNCSNILKGDADKHFYQANFKIDTTDLYQLVSKYNEIFTSSSGKKTIGLCHNNEVCKYCKDLLYSLYMIANSLEYKDLSAKDRIKEWYNDANTFTSRSDNAYNFKNHLIRTNSTHEIMELYNLLNSSQKSFLLGEVKSEDNVEEIILRIKENLIQSDKYYH